MSRLRALRAVSTELRRKFHAAELRRITRPDLSVRDGRALTTVNCSSTVVQTTTKLGVTPPVIAPMTTLLLTTSAIATTPERTEPVTAPQLRYELMTLQSVARQHGIRDPRFAAIGEQIEALLDERPSLPTDAVRLTLPQLVSEVESLETSVVDAVCEAETIKALSVAAVEALRQVGLIDVTVDARDGGITVTGRDLTGRSAELELTTSSVILDVESPGDAVHPLHPQAGDVCKGAAALADDLQAVIPRVFAGFGVQIGDVELIQPPTRGGLSLSSRLPARTRPERRAR